MSVTVHTDQNPQLLWSSTRVL